MLVNRRDKIIGHLVIMSQVDRFSSKLPLPCLKRVVPSSAYMTHPTPLPARYECRVWLGWCSASVHDLVSIGLKSEDFSIECYPRLCHDNCFMGHLTIIESIKITSMENVSTGVLEKSKEHYLKCKDRAKNHLMYNTYTIAYVKLYYGWPCICGCQGSFYHGNDSILTLW